MTEWHPFNLNSSVRVRLTDKGREVLRQNHERDLAGLLKAYPFVAPSEVDGWTTFQLWRLMQEFGPGMSMGSDLTFDTCMEIEVETSDD